MRSIAWARKLADARELGIGHRADAARGRRPRPGWRCARLRSACAAVEHLFRGGQELAARGGQHHAARHALEQRDAELVLERLDLRADRRLADVQPLGGAGQVARASATAAKLRSW